MAVISFDVTYEGPILPWVSLAMARTTATHWQEVNGEMVFYWANGSLNHLNLIPGATKKGDRWQGVGAEVVSTIVQNWLGSVDYGEEPDTDGSLEKGWRLHNSNYGFYAILAVKPEWQVYGK